MADDNRAFGTLIAQANAAIQHDRQSEALKLLDAALMIRPGDRDAASMKGGVLGSLGRFDDALSAFQEGLASHPGAGELHYNAAFALQCLGRYEQAAEEYALALKFSPNFPEALNNQGLVLHALGRYDEAVGAFDAALKQRAIFPRAYNNRGISLARLRRFDEAIASYNMAIRLDPAYREAFNNRGIACSETGRIAEALNDYARALAVDPNYAEAHINEGFAWLLSGDYGQGLKKYEWRPAGQFGGAPRISTKPEWHGQDIQGKTVLLSAEQGLGDTIQFARFAAVLAEKGARVILQVQPALVPLISSLRGVQAVIAVGEALPEHDFQRALHSVPYELGTRLDTIPAKVPYLAVEPARVTRWRERLAATPARLRIGIAWRGSAATDVDAGRSASLAEFAPLAAIEGARLISLQKDAVPEELGRLPPGMRVETLDDLDTGDGAFLDTAAVMESLDLVVTTDTAMVHLAGALGRPTCLALKAIPEWRWLLQREDSPWYPTVRIFRQSKQGNWSELFKRMAETLNAETARKRSTN